MIEVSNSTIIIVGVRMGILESCENPGISSRMSLELDASMIRMSDRRITGNNEFYFQESKMNLFGDIFYKKHGDKTEFVLQTHMTNRATEVLNHSLRIYEDSASFIHEKGSKLKIVIPIEDPNCLGRQVYLMKVKGKPRQLVVRLVSFNKYEDQAFKKGLYEVAMLESNMTQSSNRYGYVYQDAFVVQSGIDKDINDKCLVIIGDFCNATLDEMITFRKMVSSGWTQKQFEAIAYQLIKGVADMHQHKLYHRDIRPHNIFYSPEKRGYVLGGFSNAISLSRANPNMGINLAGVPYYMPRYLTGSEEDYSQHYNYDPEQLDIYSLGVTLLNTIFLDQFMPAEVLIQSVRKQSNKYRLLSTILRMLQENPPSLSQILMTLPSQIQNREVDEQNNVEACRYKMKPQDEEFVNRKKNIANGYYQMFMYDEWIEQIGEVVNYYELNRDSMQLAELYKQIADVYSEHGQDEMMSEYYSRAGSLYLQISNDCMTDNKNEQVIKYLEKGIDCNRRGYKCQPNTELAYLLNKLAMNNQINEEYEIARAFQEQALQIIGKVNGVNSAQYAEMLIDAGKIEMQFKEFKLCENMLKAALKIIEKKPESKENLTLQARILEALGNNFRFKAMVRSEKCHVYRKKSEDSLLDALEIFQKLEGSIHPNVGSVLMNLGSLYFDRKEFDKAKRAYEKSLVVKQHSNHGKQSVQIGECLTYLANSEKFLREYDKATKHYDEAIEMFRKVYGNDHNHNTAIAIGNLGLLYKQMGRRRQQQEYLKLAQKILADLFGEGCPDYQYFHRQLYG